MSKRPIGSPSIEAPRLGVNVLPSQWARVSSPPAVKGPVIASALVAQIASLLAPPLCAACGSTHPTEAVVCAQCEADLAAAPRVIEPGPPGVDLAVAASPFDGVARD